MPTAGTERTAVLARAIGSEVPAAPFGFRVHSVFASALNLRVVGTRFLVTLLPAGGADLPQGIELATAERFEVWPVRAGDGGRCDGSRLTFDPRPGAAPPTVWLGGALRRTRAPLPALTLSRVAASAAWAACAESLAARQEAAGAPLRLRALLGLELPQGAFGARLASGAAALAEALRVREAHEATRAAAGLVGLGTGLTPAGDDFLCGVLAALDAGSAGCERERRFLATWGESLAPRLAGTHLVSATFLGCALAGAYGGALAALVSAFAVEPPDADGAQRAMARLCDIGHTSGMDTATGFLFACASGPGAEARTHAPSIRVHRTAHA